MGCMGTHADVTLLRSAAVLTRRGYKRTQLYREIERGLMPPGIARTRRNTVWPAYEIDAINAAEIAGKSVEERRALVQQLVAKRETLELSFDAEIAASC